MHRYHMPDGVGKEKPCLRIENAPAAARARPRENAPAAGVRPQASGGANLS
jgi:hypothetical protein